MTVPVPTKPRKPRSEGVNHILHALLTFFTAGLWFPMWLLSALIVRRQNDRYETALARYEADMVRYRIQLERKITR